MLLVCSKATKMSEMWFIIIIIIIMYYDCIIIINILMNDAAKVLFIVTSNLTRAAIYQRYCVIVYILMQKSVYVQTQ